MYEDTAVFTSPGVLIDSVWGPRESKHGVCLCEDLDGKLVTQGPKEKKNTRPGELGEGTHTVHDRANFRAEKQFTKTTEL